MGEKHGQSKMTNEKVLQIRQLFSEGKSTNSIAKQLNLKQQNVWCICTKNLETLMKSRNEFTTNEEYNEYLRIYFAGLALQGLISSFTEKAS